ncbi:MAG: hypothetical protein VX610_07675 [SAR324 cluster bacterium]|nr:hypothetical protein [SAR324 cluster bacterium]
MAHPLFLIVDTRNPRTALFWRRHGLRIMEQLVPGEFVSTAQGGALEAVYSRAVLDGWGRIVVIGSPDSVNTAFQVLMGVASETREKLQAGFWPLGKVEFLKYLLQPTQALSAILQVFRSAHTIPVDVMQVQYLTPKMETGHAWCDFVVDTAHPSAATTTYVDEQDRQYRGRMRFRIALHEEPLNSLTMNPGRLVRSPKFRVYGEKLLSAHDLLGSVKNLADPQGANEQLLESGRQVEIQGNWANLTLHLEGVRLPVQSVHLQVRRKAFQLIIPVMPIRQKEPLRERLLAFPAREAVATSRELSPKSLREEEG